MGFASAGLSTCSPYYDTWHMQHKLAPILFQDDDPRHRAMPSSDSVSLPAAQVMRRPRRQAPTGVP